MKSTAFDFTEDYNDLVKVIDLCQLLLKLNIPCSRDAMDEAEGFHCEVFCGDCEDFRDQCRCHPRCFSYDEDYFDD